jgi:hypothetical protein
MKYALKMDSIVFGVGCHGGFTVAASHEPWGYCMNGTE